MTDYKSTLNLPQTDFPMKADLAKREPVMQKAWQDNNLYEKLRKTRKGKAKFILEDGPPYANGQIHVGHAVNKILKDIIVKAKSFSGFDAPLIPGWDCHGLPIELNVEKKHGKPGRKISPRDFRLACREYASSQVELQREGFKRLGVLADWQHPYLTMDFSYEANTIRSLANIIAQGHLLKGFKPVHWCLDCASALAEAEVEYADKTSPAIDVAFKVVNFEAIPPEWQSTAIDELIIPIWTTTPWTLPANQAVALNADINYGLYVIGSTGYVIAEALAETTLTRFGVEVRTADSILTGKALEALKLQHPLFDRVVPVILGDHVTTEAGTGAVHTAPAHGVDDYQVGKLYHLPIDNPVGDDGCYISSLPLFAGLHVSKANPIIIEQLQNNNALLHSANLTHSYPHCWRHKTPLIFRATPQWFISMDQQGLRGTALQIIDKVQWVPEWGKPRIEAMVANRPDWCISRQRTWGVPLALFVHKETGELHPDTVALMEAVAKKVEAHGIEAWFDLEEAELLGSEASNYRKINDVLDVWFDSGVTHACVLKTRAELSYPADLIIEGSDQHRGWFQSQLLTAAAIEGNAPYRDVLTHGFVVDGQGRKMSKSLGNVIAPDEVTKTLGADILRLWVASIDYRTEIAASKEILNRTGETYRRIRNTVRFLLANLHGFDANLHAVAGSDLLPLDQWALAVTAKIQAEIISAYDNYQFHLVVQKIHHFCAIEMGSFYLDIIKDRQYTMAANSRGRRSAQTALFHMTHAICRWLAPILSFTAEEVWQHFSGANQESIFLEEWYQIDPVPAAQPFEGDYWQMIRQVRDAVNKEIEQQRNAGKIGSALEAEVELYCDSQLLAKLTVLENELRFVLITSSAKLLPLASAPKDSAETELNELKLKVLPTQHTKCDRCWHRCADVNENITYPGLCGRCVENVAGTGEIRRYA